MANNHNPYLNTYNDASRIRCKERREDAPPLRAFSIWRFRGSIPVIDVSVIKKILEC